MRAELDTLSYDINGNLLLTFRTSKGNLADIDKYNGKTLELTIKEYKGSQQASEGVSECTI